MPAYLSKIEPLSDPRWDQFVNNHPFGWITHTSGWKKVLEKAFKHLKGHYWVLLKRGRIVAGLPLFEVDSWLTGRRLVSIPFATLSDPLVSDEAELQALLEPAKELLGKCEAGFMEIRTLLSSGFFPENGYVRNCYFKHHYLVLDRDPEQLKKNFHRTCVRQRINRALDSRLHVRVGENEKDLEEFFHLYLITRKRISLPPLPYLFVRSLWEEFHPKGNITLLLARQEEKPLAGLLLFKFRDRVSADFAGSDETYKDLSPNHLVFWEAIKLSSQEGFKIFDFGRTSPANVPLMDFKRRWGTGVMDIGNFYWPPVAVEEDEGRESKISYRAVQTLCRKSPLGFYPYIGEFCYRHMS